MSAGQQNMYLDVNLRKLDCVSPNLKPPEEIGSFSIDIDKTFENSKKRLKYFIKPPNPRNVNFDLRKGFETSIIKEKGNDIHILRWIKENMGTSSNIPDKGNERQPSGDSGQAGSLEDTRNHEVEKAVDQYSTDKELDDVQTALSELNVNKDEAQGDKLREEKSSRRNLETDFVSRRGLLAKIMLTPYEDKDEWSLAVTLYKGTYYLQEIVSEERKRREANLKDDEMSCWGWKFEQYLTADREDGLPNTDVPYNNCEKFYTVVKTRLNDHSLVFSGEVDAINTNGNYMEFKTNKEFGHQGHIKTFKRFKTKKWWAQSHLIGVKEIVCGFRDENGIVRRLEFYKTDEIPSISSGIYNGWKANVCTNFLDQFLSFVKSSIKIDDPKIVHTVKYIPFRGRIECSPPLTDSEYSFLPQWFIDGTA